MEQSPRGPLYFMCVTSLKGMDVTSRYNSLIVKFDLERIASDIIVLISQIHVELQRKKS